MKEELIFSLWLLVKGREGFGSLSFSAILEAGERRPKPSEWSGAECSALLGIGIRIGNSRWNLES